MKPLDVLTVGMLSAAVALPGDAVLADAARKPNIVVIIAPTMSAGGSSVGCLDGVQIEV